MAASSLLASLPILCDQINSGAKLAAGTYQGVRTEGGLWKHCEQCPGSRQAVVAAQTHRH